MVHVRVMHERSQSQAQEREPPSEDHKFSNSWEEIYIPWTFYFGDWQGMVPSAKYAIQNPDPLDIHE